MFRRRLSRPLAAAALLLGLAALPRMAGGQTVPGLTLAAAIERAVAANPTIAAARLQRPIDAAAVAVAGARPDPEFTYEWSKETPRQAIGGTLPIELGSKRQRRIDLANAAVAVSDAELARVIADVRNEVRRAYFEAVAADARVRI